MAFPKTVIMASVIIGVTIWFGQGENYRVNASTPLGSEKANALVKAYAKHVGANHITDSIFDHDHDVSFGNFGFRYFPEKNQLQGRVFTGKSHIKDWPDRAHFERKVIAGLNDPAIGGMYDRGGGYFVLSEEKQMYFLVKDYDLSAPIGERTNERTDELTTDRFVRDFKNLNELAAIWVTSWGPHAARQSYGSEALPVHRIDRLNNPYGTH